LNHPPPIPLSVFASVTFFMYAITGPWTIQTRPRSSSTLNPTDLMTSIDDIFCRAYQSNQFLARHGSQGAHSSKCVSTSPWQSLLPWHLWSYLKTLLDLAPHCMQCRCLEHRWSADYLVSEKSTPMSWKFLLHRSLGFGCHSWQLLSVSCLFSSPKQTCSGLTICDTTSGQLNKNRMCRRSWKGYCCRQCALEFHDCRRRKRTSFQAEYCTNDKG
jgi:hypothetical protein